MKKYRFFLFIILFWITPVFADDAEKEQILEKLKNAAESVEVDSALLGEILTIHSKKSGVSFITLDSVIRNIQLKDLKIEAKTYQEFVDRLSAATSIGYRIIAGVVIFGAEKDLEHLAKLDAHFLEIPSHFGTSDLLSKALNLLNKKQKAKYDFSNEVMDVVLAWVFSNTPSELNFGIEFAYGEVIMDFIGKKVDFRVENPTTRNALFYTLAPSGFRLVLERIGSFGPRIKIVRE